MHLQFIHITEPPASGVGVKCGGGGGVKVGGNLLPAVYLVRGGVWSHGRKALFSLSNLVNLP